MCVCQWGQFRWHIFQSEGVCNTQAAVLSNSCYGSNKSFSSSACDVSFKERKHYTNTTDSYSRSVILHIHFVLSTTATTTSSLLCATYAINSPSSSHIASASMTRVIDRQVLRLSRADESTQFCTQQYGKLQSYLTMNR